MPTALDANIAEQLMDGKAPVQRVAPKEEECTD
jgi:hypothetical protein